MAMKMFAIRFQLANYLGHLPDFRNLGEYVSLIPGVLISDTKNLYNRQPPFPNDVDIESSSETQRDRKPVPKRNNE